MEYQKRAVHAALTIIVGLGVGCASVPPPKAEIATADQSLRKAEQADAGEYAPLDLRKARDQLDAARTRMKSGDNVEARRLAEDASLDAELAQARAREAKLKRAAEEMRAQIEALQVEAERAGEMVR